MDIQNIGKKIKTRRTELNMSQKDLASKLNVSNQLISKWETGESAPALEYLDILSTTLKLPLNKLIGESTYKKPLTKQAKQNIFISVITFCVALFITSLTLLTFYVFVPYGNKKHYLDLIENSITKSLDVNGFYNLELYSELDGEKQNYSIITLQGYLDKNNNVVSYNSETYETIKNNIKTDEFSLFKYDYNKPSEIINVKDLFASELKKIDEDNNSLDDIKDIEYIRKIKSGFYFELNNSIFTDELTANQKKNFKLTDKIKGEVKIKNGIFESMFITIKYLNKPSNEHFTITSHFVLKNEKPEIEHVNLSAKVWNIETRPYEFSEFLTSITDNKVNPLNSTVNELLFKKDVCQDSNGDFTIVEGDYLYTINQNNLEDVKKEKIANLNTITINNKTYDYKNGYIYTFENKLLNVYNPETLEIQNTLTLPDEAASIIYLYNGNCYCSYDRRIYAYNLETGYKEHIAYISSIYNWTAHYSNNYAYFEYENSSNYKDMQCVLNLDTGNYQTYLKDDIKNIVYVDSNGNIFYKNDTYSNIKIYNTDYVLYGHSFLKEENGIIYISNSSYISSNPNIYIYKNFELINSINHNSVEQSNRRDFGEYYAIIKEDYITKTANDQKIYIPYLSINGSYLYTKVFDVWNNNLIIDIGDKYIAMYSISDLSRPKIVANKPYALDIKIFGNNKIMRLQLTNESEVNYYLLNC